MGQNFLAHAWVWRSLSHGIWAEFFPNIAIGQELESQKPFPTGVNHSKGFLLPKSIDKMTVKITMYYFCFHLLHEAKKISQNKFSTSLNIKKKKLNPPKARLSIRTKTGFVSFEWFEIWLWVIWNLTLSDLKFEIWFEIFQNAWLWSYHATKE